MEEENIALPSYDQREQPSIAISESTHSDAHEADVVNTPDNVSKQSDNCDDYSYLKDLFDPTEELLSQKNKLDDICPPENNPGDNVVSDSAVDTALNPKERDPSSVTPQEIPTENSKDECKKASSDCKEDKSRNSKMQSKKRKRVYRDNNQQLAKKIKSSNSKEDNKSSKSMTEDLNTEEISNNNIDINEDALKEMNVYGENETCYWCSTSYDKNIFSLYENKYICLRCSFNVVQNNKDMRNWKETQIIGKSKKCYRCNTKKSIKRFKNNKSNYCCWCSMKKKWEYNKNSNMK